MKLTESWVIFETESAGMARPLHIVEIAAQAMRGWKPEGTKFRVLINHDAPIELAAQAVHGYSQEYLRAHGQEPRLAHTLFRDYVGSRPLVSHNLPMDWDRLLAPECQQLGIPTPGRRGFCLLRLARRVLPDAASFSMGALTKRFKLLNGSLRGAAPDVDALVQLCQKWLGPRLAAGGIEGFDAVAAFSVETTPAKCRKHLEAALQGKPLPEPPAPDAPPSSPATCLEEFQLLVKEIMADGVMTTAEFLILMDWLRDCPHTDVYPINRLHKAVDRVTAVDGCVSSADQQRLEQALEFYLRTGEAPPQRVEP